MYSRTNLSPSDRGHCERGYDVPRCPYDPAARSSGSDCRKLFMRLVWGVVHPQVRPVRGLKSKRPAREPG